MLRSGEAVLEYVLDEPVGRGGFGEVWRAFHRDSGSPVALKVLHPDLACQPEAVARFAVEVEAMSATRHPSVAQLYDTGYVDARPFLVMEYVVGTPLSQYGQLAPVSAREVVVRVGGALAVAHRHGVVHRDIKPDNIVVGEGGQRVVLLDFGVAKLMDTAAVLTARNMTVGSVAYCAPEQLRGEPVDARTDIYALSLVLFELLTGKHPFGDVHSFALPHLHMHGKRPMVSAHGAHLAGFDAICARGMARDPADRPACVEGWLALLPG